MISYLKGSIADITEKNCTIVTSGGVGYLVFLSGSLQGKYQAGDIAEISITTIVREQEITLYGFSNAAEKTLFEKLITISGIGPKIGLQIVSTPTDLFFDAVQKGDVDFISRTPGLGKKTAQKIIIELKGKLDLKEEQSGNVAVAEALDALQNLGYDHAMIKTVLKNAPEESAAEDLVKYFLTNQK
ncbi:UNVERIFIED_CONTAM: hypothetical protein GTU68_013598 [Idotea baltica]|nr:hypothetical protein [Idotea baltica]